MDFTSISRHSKSKLRLMLLLLPLFLPVFLASTIRLHTCALENKHNLLRSSTLHRWHAWLTMGLSSTQTRKMLGSLRAEGTAGNGFGVFGATKRKEPLKAKGGIYLFIYVSYNMIICTVYICIYCVYIYIYMSIYLALDYICVSNDFGSHGYEQMSWVLIGEESCFVVQTQTKQV